MWRRMGASRRASRSSPLAKPRALSDRETELLFALIARLKADGVSIVYISDRMAEVFALGDRITVLRDGRRIGGVRPADVTPDQLVRMMVGRTVDMTYPRKFADQRAPSMPGRQRGIASATRFEGVGRVFGVWV